MRNRGASLGDDGCEPIAVHVLVCAFRIDGLAPYRRVKFLESDSLADIVADQERVKTLEVMLEHLLAVVHCFGSAGQPSCRVAPLESTFLGHLDDGLELQADPVFVAGCPKRSPVSVFRRSVIFRQRRVWPLCRRLPVTAVKIVTIGCE